MGTKRKILEVVNKIVLEKTSKAINQIDAYENESVIRKMTDELVGLYAELARKQNTPITRELLEKNGFEVAVPRFMFPLKTWRLKANRAFWFDEYEEDRNCLDDGEFGFVKKGSFLFRFANKMVEVKTVADLEDTLELCGIDKKIEV